MERTYLVNRNIKRVIDETGRKQSVVAEKAGIRRDVLSRIVNRKRPVFADEVLPISKALDVSVEELFAEDDAREGA